MRTTTSIFGYRQVLKPYVFKGFATQLYEAKLPPLLRFFHVYDISPSGWVCLPSRKWKRPKQKTTLCDYEFIIKAKDLAPLPHKETAVPIKICSMDIEASSSHGDFPVAKKTYKKFAGELQTYWTAQHNNIMKLRKSEQLHLLRNQIMTAFEMAETPSDGISKVYTKEEVKEDEILELFDTIAHTSMKNALGNERVSKTTRSSDSHDDDEVYASKKSWNPYVKRKNSIVIITKT